MCVCGAFFKIESVGYKYADLATMTKRYDPARLVEGYNTMPDGEKIFYISNPVLTHVCLPALNHPRPLNFDPYLMH